MQYRYGSIVRNIILPKIHAKCYDGLKYVLYLHSLLSHELNCDSRLLLRGFHHSFTISVYQQIHNEARFLFYDHVEWYKQHFYTKIWSIIEE
jgi:hypothetical protein